MIRKLSFAAATVVAVSLLASAHGKAATIGPLGGLKSAGVVQSNVEKVHGWHRTCRRGLNGYHRHVPGVGRIQCTARKCWRNRWGIRRCRWF
jgi:hypothetical protein